jgi:signal transduction histidine kinase
MMTTITQRATSRYLESLIKEDLIKEAELISASLKQSILNKAREDELPMDLLPATYFTLSRFRLDSHINILVEYPINSIVIGKTETLSKQDILSITSNKDTFNKPTDFISHDDQGFVTIYSKLPENILPLRAQNAYIVMAIEKDSITTFTRQITRIQFMFMFGILIITVIVSSSLSRSITSPLKKLNRQAKRIAKRDFSESLSIKTGDEIEQLSDSINLMSQSLKESDARQKRFIQNASHELKTPLMSIQGYTEGMIDGFFDKDDDNLQIINTEVKRLSDIVRNISILSQMDSVETGLQLKPVSLHALVTDAIAKVRGFHGERDIDIVISESADPQVLLDKDQFIQALINILSNGIRYAETLIDIKIHETDTTIIVSITDDGPGIPSEDIDKIFERFYKGNGGQSGLGLSITRAIIENHGGTIIAQNLPPLGANFTLTLPKGARHA